MSFAGKNDVEDAGTGQPATLANPQGPTLSANAGENRTRPPRLRNLAALLRRENVEFVLVVGGVRGLRVSAELADGSTDMKAIAVGDVGGSAEGCFVLLRLSDNPLQVGAGFFELRPAASDAGSR
jgi:hypothetical protein